MTTPERNYPSRPADALRERAEADYQRIRDDKTRTETAKAAAIARRHAKLAAEMTTMQGTTTSTRAAELAAAKRAAFSPDALLAGASAGERASAMMSFRDAQQRASQLGSPAEAQYLLDHAQASGDDLLALAIGNHCAQIPGMESVADSYLGQHPERAAAMNTLTQMIDSTAKLNAVDMWEFVAPEPIELSRMGWDARHAALADPGWEG